jgi:hypothetical protein
MDSLTKHHAELSAAPARKPKVRWKDTGRTVADEWAARDTEGRRQLMMAAGFTIDIAKINSGTVLAHTFDPDLERRARLRRVRPDGTRDPKRAGRGQVGADVRSSR